MGMRGRAVRVVQPLLRRFDVRLSRWSRSYDYQRVRYLRDLDVTAVVDVGANEGQYGNTLRADGYQGRLLSIEPQERAFRQLARLSARDPDWDCIQCGLGGEDGVATLGVSANSTSSSVLPILDSHVKAAPQSRYESAERIVLRTLDSVVGKWTERESLIGLKLDVQGFEAEVLRGAQSTLAEVAFLEVELSLIPLYEGQVLSDQMIGHLGDLGFSLANLCTGFSDPRTGRVLQFDGIFLRD
jgi:FkbM family methyltransferase